MSWWRSGFGGRQIEPARGGGSLTSDVPKGQILAMAQNTANSLNGDQDRGCPFANSYAELTDPNHPARAVINTLRADKLNRLQWLCGEAGISDPESVAKEIIFVLEGAQVSAQSLPKTDVAQRLLRIVAAILATG